MIHTSSMPPHRLTALLCLSIVIAARLPAVAADCQRKCGAVEIPYPFGVGGSGCARHGFELSCNHTGNGVYKPFYNDVELLGILLLEGQVRMRMYISSSCYNSSSEDKIQYYNWSLNLTGTPYRFADTGNKFTVVGCRTLAYIADNVNVGIPERAYLSGCIAVCRRGDVTTLTNGSCSGIGCCQTVIPKGLQYYGVWFDSGFNATEMHNISRCGYAAVVETSNFTFSTNYATSSAFNDTYGGQAPLLVDWAVGNETCEVARQKPDYACVNSNSECFNSPNGDGYICNCSEGFHGNPYLAGPDGCQDIDECMDQTKYPCYGTCNNKPGTFVCFCPSGTRGNAFIRPCEKEGQAIGVTIGLSAGFGMLLVSLSGIFLFNRWKRGIKRRQRRQYFLKNQGLLLEQLILSNENASDMTKIFSLEEMEKATNNFDETRILGRGGHGMVYKGILSDQRVVAIKKSKFIDKDEINQFINEVAILPQINHRNIVKLFGCCLETEVPLLVYDFVSNGSLFQILHHNANSGFSISWNDYLRIATEAAGALYYLHSAASVSVFHRDVKSSNILLDENYTAKVSDFGASRLVPVDQTHIVTNVQGTLGYLDPEYYHTAQLNDKSDVYSFGVVLVELLLRKEPIFTNESGLKQSLSNYFVQEMKVRPITEIVAPQVLEEATEDEINSVAYLAEVCLRLRGEERPTMKKVEMTLQSLREKRFKVCQVTGGNGAENQPLLTTRAIYQSLGVELRNRATSASQRSGNCYSMQQEFISSASLPR